MVGAGDASDVLKATTVYLSLGANLGDCRKSLRLAVEQLASHPKVTLDTNRDVARLFQTSPVGCDRTQPPYLNTVARIETSLSPTALLAITQQIESKLGRIRPGKNKQKNQPRTIDIDILFFGDLDYHDKWLEIPHPRLTERRFVLEPLADLAPERVLPAVHATVTEIAHSRRLRDADQTAEVVAERGWAV